jgi:hypothetical protein
MKMENFSDSPYITVLCSFPAEFIGSQAKKKLKKLVG